jgi:chromosome segregation ATPase
MSVELNKTMDYLKSQLNDQAVVSKLQEYIKDLEGQRDWAQQEYGRVQDKLQETDYELENLKRATENNRTAMEGFVKENQSLRNMLKELVGLWA